MKRFGVISAAVLFCLVGTTAAAYAQQDTTQTRHEEQAKPEKRKGNRQAKAEQQRQKHTQQPQEKQQQDRAQQQRLAEGSDLKSEPAGIDPPFVGYRELRKALLTYVRLAGEDNGEKLPMPTDISEPPYEALVIELLVEGDNCRSAASIGRRLRPSRACKIPHMVSTNLTTKASALR